MSGRFFRPGRQPSPVLSQTVMVTVDVPALRLISVLGRIGGDPLHHADNLFRSGLTALAEHELARRCFVHGDQHESTVALAVLLEAHSGGTYLCQDRMCYRLDRDTRVWVPLWTPDIQYAEEAREQVRQEAAEAWRLLQWELNVDRLLVRKYGNAHGSREARSERAQLLEQGPPDDWPKNARKRL
jgi:hypothetical protein